MKRELVERAHDQARAELGFCVQAPDGHWCDAHASLKFPGEEACRAMARAYTIAESAVEAAEPLIRADRRSATDDELIEAGAQALYRLSPEEYQKPLDERHDGDAEHVQAAVVYFAVVAHIAGRIEAAADDAYTEIQLTDYGPDCSGRTRDLGRVAGMRQAAQIANHERRPT